MRIVAFDQDGTTVSGVIQEDTVHALLAADGSTVTRAALPALLASSRDTLRVGPSLAALSDQRLAAPVDPRKIVAVGLNYTDHVDEAKAAAPTEPLLFAKYPSSVIGPLDTIEWDPDLTDAVDFEAELGVIVGPRARHVAVADALDHVVGYTCVNDVSARDLQFRDGQWVRGKSLDTFCPIGPWLVTADELTDPTALPIWCDVSGERLQEGNTRDMIFSVAELIAWISTSFTLETGDLIATGTPPGVGYFRRPPRLLRDADTVSVGIGGIGELVNPTRSRTRRPNWA